MEEILLTSVECTWDRSMMLGRQKCIWLSHWYLSLVLLMLKLLLRGWKDRNYLVLIKFWQNWSKQVVLHYILRSTNF